jgi:ubiquinone/menaquinone biosynthesis C-methylase UbiE
LKARPAGFAKLWGYSVGFYGVWLIHVGRETGLLEKLANPISPRQLASALAMHLPAVHAWCSAAVSYGLVGKKNGRLYLKPRIKALLLDKKNPHYLGGQFSYLALRSLEYGHLADLFRSGRTREMSSTLRAIEQATDWDHYALLASIRRNKKLHMLLTNGCKMLDVGCGTGTLLGKIKATYPKSWFTGIDPSEKAVAIARKNVNQITIIQQAGESMSFESEFDLIYLGESLYAAKDKQKVMSNCQRALKRGGTIAIVEGLLPESNLQSDDNRLIMGMQLDFALQGHSFMTRKEMEKLLGNFSKVHFEELGGAVYLVTATK